MRNLMPGKAGIPVFLLAAVAGLAVWVFSTPAISGKLLGEAAYEATYTHPLLAFFGLPLLAAIAFGAGSVSPRGFWLWGVAIVSLHSLAYVWLTIWTSSRGAFGPEGIGPRQILSLAFVEILMLIALATACTVGSAAGAGLRFLWLKLRGEPAEGHRSGSGVE